MMSKAQAHFLCKSRFQPFFKLTKWRQHDVLENNLVSLKDLSFWFEFDAVDRAVHHERVFLQTDLLTREEHQAGSCHQD